METVKMLGILVVLLTVYYSFVSSVCEDPNEHPDCHNCFKCACGMNSTGFGKPCIQQKDPKCCCCITDDPAKSPNPKKTKSCAGWPFNAHPDCDKCFICACGHTKPDFGKRCVHSENPKCCCCANVSTKPIRDDRQCFVCCKNKPNYGYSCTKQSDCCCCEKP